MKHKKTGLTIIELLIVLGIISILVGRLSLSENRNSTGVGVDTSNSSAAGSFWFR